MRGVLLERGMAGVVELGPAVMALVIAGLDAITCFNRVIGRRLKRGVIGVLRWV